MNILCFQEGVRLTPSHLMNQLLTKNINVNDVLKQLELSHVLKHRVPKIDLGEIMVESEQIEQDWYEYYTFKYVGLILINDLCLIVYPKYIKNIAKDFYGNKQKLLQLMQVIDKYQSSTAYDASVDGISESFLSLQIKLLKDYLEYGLYFNDEAVIEVNCEGETLWEKTINESTAYLVEGTPFYFDLFTKTNVLNEMDTIRRIHAAIITEISSNLSPILPILGMSTLVLSDEEKNDFGDNDYLEYLIEQELGRQFITSKQLLLYDLINYIRQATTHRSSDTIEIYGTSSFNLIWENICKKIYHDNLDHRLKSLNLSLTGMASNGEWIDYSEREKLKDIVDRPLWLEKKSGESVEASKSLELDVLHINHQKQRFEIFDGKYYNIRFNDNKVEGQPGVGDVTKQYLYQLAYKNIAEINGYSFTNAFIVPIDELDEDIGNGVQIATVKLKMLQMLGLNDIKVIARDCEKFYAEYLAL